MTNPDEITPTYKGTLDELEALLRSDYGETMTFNQIDTLISALLHNQGIEKVEEDIKESSPNGSNINELEEQLKDLITQKSSR